MTTASAPEWVSTLPQWAQDGYAYIEGLWYEGVFDLSYGEVLTAIGVILLSLMIRGLFARTVVRAITRAAAGTKTNLDDALVTGQ